MTDFSYIQSNVDKVRNEIADAAAKAGRDPAGITLIAVTKTYSAEHAAAASKAGVTDTGENRVQEAVPKINSLKDSAKLSPLRWHLIGHLQSNKAKLAVRYFDMIHSVDSVRLAREINRQAEQAEKLMSILIQINVSGEESKSGMTLQSAESEIEVILEGCENLVVNGLMTMPPLADAESARPVFKELRELRDKLACKINHPRFQPKELSMGMSGDFRVAIEEGSTMVRIGTAIFGQRSTAQ